MATTNHGRQITLTAASDLSAKVCYFGKITATKGVDVHSVANAMPHGVIAEGVASGRETSLLMPGQCVKVVAGSGGITDAAKVMAASDGTAIAWVNSAGNVACGVALGAASAGEIFEMYFSNVGQG